MDSTVNWHPYELNDQVGLLALRIAAWWHMEYPENAPAAGEHNADAIKAGHGAVVVIDKIVQELQALRAQLVSELRADSDALADRVDAMLAKPTADLLAEIRKDGGPAARA
jgi:hypothetical protein